VRSASTTTKRVRASSSWCLAKAREALTADDFRQADPAVRVKKSTVDKATVDAVSAMLRGRTFHSNAKKYGYAWSHNLIEDTLEVETNAPTEVMAPVREAFGSRIRVSYGDVGRQSRLNDPAPHWGGAALVVGTATVCTSGFAVQDVVTGSRYITTAGHCGVASTAVRSPEGGHSWGVIAVRAPYPAWDFALTPSRRMRPRSGSYNRHIGFTSVDLPTPFRPTMANVSPGWISRLRPSKTGAADPG
jgi:hypothetical protein